MNIEYRKIYNRNYLILSDCNIPDYKECYRSKMLKSNKLDNFMTYDTQNINGIVQFTYDISSKQSIYNFYENSLIDYETIRHLIMSLKGAFDTLNNYLLEPDFILLDPKLIYMNIATKTIYFCYCPGHKNNFYDSLSNFLCYILSKIDHNDNNSIILAYSLQQQSIQDNYTFDDLMQILNKPVFEHEKPNVKQPIKEAFPDSSKTCKTDNSQKAFTLIETGTQTPLISDGLYPNDLSDDNIFAALDLTNTKDSKKNQTITIPENAVPVTLVFLCTFIFGYCSLVRKLFSPATFIILTILCMGVIIWFFKIKQSPKPRSISDSFRLPESTTTLSELLNETDKQTTPSSYTVPYSDSDLKSETTICEDTVILGYRKTANTPQLIYTGTDFTSETDIDCFPFVIGKMSENVNMVIDNPMISRIHARIYMKENRFYIEDMNSSNGTYINDTLIQPHTLTEITIGDTITFAHLTYIFQ